MSAALLKNIKKVARLISIITFIALFAVLVYLVLYHEPLLVLRNVLEDKVSPGLFVLLMFFLPLLAAPISVFLVFVGMKFGLIPGLLISAAAMFFHMAATYWLVTLWLYRRGAGRAGPFNVTLQRFAARSSRWYAFIVMLVPGLPYALKNILLSLTGIGFRPYIFINWTAQFSMGIPLVMFGRAVIEMNVIVLAVALVLMISIYLMKLFLKRRFDTDEKESVPDP